MFLSGCGWYDDYVELKKKYEIAQAEIQYLRGELKKVKADLEKSETLYKEMLR